jgi:4-hydroxy-2-oxoheptanedioate aldolase
MRSPRRQAWAEGRRTTNGWLSIPSNFAGEVMAHQGWDSVTIDLQRYLI